MTKPRDTHAHMAGAAYARAALALALALAVATAAATVKAQQTEWLRGHATFYGGADASGTMGKLSSLCMRADMI